MTPVAAPARPSHTSTLAQLTPDLSLGLDNLRLHKLRSLLTMLGLIFGVAAVVSMLSIGAGAQQRVMAFIEQLGVRNLIVEAKEAVSYEEYSKNRKISPGLTLADYRVIGTNMSRVVAASPRKRFTPSKMLPKPQHEMPVVYGVAPSYLEIAGLEVVLGRWFGPEETARATPVCVLGGGAKSNLFGVQDALGQYLKVNEQWFHVIGVVGSQLTAPAAMAGVPSQDVNNLIYVPVYSAIFRLQDTMSEIKDEIDGVYLKLDPQLDSFSAAQIVRGILTESHHGANDFSVIVPAELLAEQRRTQRIFDVVMVAIASISLLVGGIGIMNIMLASILERTREIGVRRAVGARRRDIVRQFLIEAMLISVVGGLIGVGFGVGMSRIIALLAGWSTIVTLSSVLLAFLVSVSVGLIFGTYPAIRAARLDPAEAIRYE